MLCSEAAYMWGVSVSSTLIEFWYAVTFFLTYLWFWRKTFMNHCETGTFTTIDNLCVFCVCIVCIIFIGCVNIEHPIKWVKKKLSKSTTAIDLMTICMYYMAKLVFTWQMFNLCDWRWLCAHTTNSIMHSRYTSFTTMPNKNTWSNCESECVVCVCFHVPPSRSDSKNTIIFEWMFVSLPFSLTYFVQTIL